MFTNMVSGNFKISESKPKLADMRGMSDPMFFAFDVLDHGNRMLCHAVIFTSYEIASGSERKLKLCSPEDEPRLRSFIKYCFDNYCSKEKQELTKELERLETRMAEHRQSLDEIQKFINSQQAKT